MPYQKKKRFSFSILTANRTVPKYGPFTVFLMVKTEKLMIFGSVRFALFEKSPKTVRFLERYGSRYKILTENGNELCTVRFALFNEKTEHGGLFGAVRLAVKNRNGKRCFFATVR